MGRWVDYTREVLGDGKMLVQTEFVVFPAAMNRNSSPERKNGLKPVRGTLSQPVLTGFCYQTPNSYSVERVRSSLIRVVF